MNVLNNSITNWEAKPWFKWQDGMVKLPVESPPSSGRHRPDLGHALTRIRLLEQIRVAYGNVVDKLVLNPEGDDPDDDLTEIRVRFNDKSKIKITTKGHRRGRAFDVLIHTLDANAKRLDLSRFEAPAVAAEANVTSGSEIYGSGDIGPYGPPTKGTLRRIVDLTGEACSAWTPSPHQTAVPEYRLFRVTFANCMPIWQAFVVAISSQRAQDSVVALFSRGERSHEVPTCVEIWPGDLEQVGPYPVLHQSAWTTVRKLCEDGVL